MKLRHGWLGGAMLVAGHGKHCLLQTPFANLVVALRTLVDASLHDGLALMTWTLLELRVLLVLLIDCCSERLLSFGVHLVPSWRIAHALRALLVLTTDTNSVVTINSAAVVAGVSYPHPDIPVYPIIRIPVSRDVRNREVGVIELDAMFVHCISGLLDTFVNVCSCWRHVSWCVRGLSVLYAGIDDKSVRCRFCCRFCYRCLRLFF